MLVGLFLANIYLQPEHHNEHRLPGLETANLPTTSPWRTRKGADPAFKSETTGHQQPSKQASAGQQKKQPSSRTEIPDYHIVFSTSCLPQQHWESYVLFYHAFKVKQRGNVTRLLSGCNPKEEQQMKEFHSKYISTLSPNFHVHFTPDFSRVPHPETESKTVQYKYMNKPFSLRHWLQESLGYRMGDIGNALPNPAYDDDIIFLIDPVMILLKPLKHDFRNDDTVLWVKKPSDLEHQYVHHGHPMAQQDGYLVNNWMSLDMKAITMSNETATYIANIQSYHGPLHWNSGPPYLMTARDAYRIASLWKDFAPRVHKQFPKLFAEMFGYIIATAHLQLPHTFLKSFVVSTTTTAHREGWELVDNLRHICTQSQLVETKSSPIPFALHYCKRYLLGTFFWSKYRLRKDFMNCNVPLLQEPDASLVHWRNWTSPPPKKRDQRGNWSQETKALSEKTAKREAFMLCGMITVVNEAVGYYKRQACGNGGNFSKVYNFHDDPG
jgi:hypothetical protein